MYDKQATENQIKKMKFNRKELGERFIKREELVSYEDQIYVTHTVEEIANKILEIKRDAVILSYPEFRYALMMADEIAFKELMTHI